MNNEQLNEIGLKLITVSKEICSNLKSEVNEEYMCKVFFERQISHMESVLLLKDKDDVILIARSMFEGALYLAYSIVHKSEECAEKWRLFPVILVKQEINEADISGEKVDDNLRSQVNSLLPECDKLFKDKNDKYPKSWLDAKNDKGIWVKQLIKTLADKTDAVFLRAYEQYYSPMSDYHHWGLRSLKLRYPITSDEQIEQIKQEKFSALCMATFCLLSTLQRVSVVFKINDTRIKQIELALKNMEGVKTTEIKLQPK